MSLRRVILCEDKYGGGFFKELISRLKNENMVPRNLGTDVAKFYGPCNVKLERQLKAMMMKRCRKFIIVVDADGGNIGIVRNRVVQHIPHDLLNITNVVVLDCEIEDWICISLGMKGNNKSSVILKHRLDYRKHKLKTYVSKLNIERLMKCSSFSQFIDAFAAS